jgi:hypothetical protein
MARFFTTYWKQGPWEDNAFFHVDHAASNELGDRGVERGDYLYIVHYRAREVFLGARLVVGRTATKAEAAEFLGVTTDEVWQAQDHVLTAPGQAQRLNPNRTIPREDLRGLTFLTGDGTETAVKFDADGAADQQTFRAVRELTPDSAATLDSLIDWNLAPRATEVLSISLSRGPCFGTCPVYTVTFQADGRAHWHGEWFVDRMGDYSGEASQADFAALVDVAIGSGFFALEDDYPPPATDLPKHEIEATTGSRDKVVRAWGTGEPAAFITLGSRIDEMAESVAWQPVSPDAQPGTR